MRELGIIEREQITTVERLHFKIALMRCEQDGASMLILIPPILNSSSLVDVKWKYWLLFTVVSKDPDKYDHQEMDKFVEWLYTGIVPKVILDTHVLDNMKPYKTWSDYGGRKD